MMHGQQNIKFGETCIYKWTFISSEFDNYIQILKELFLKHRLFES